MKRTDPKILRDIIEDSLNDAGMSTNFARQRASFMWSEVVGPVINRRTVRRYVDSSGVLHVYIDSASLKNDLQFMRSTLLSRLNEAAGSDALTDVMSH